MLQTSQARTNLITAPAQLRIVGQCPAAILKFIEVTGSLRLAPRSQCVFGDAQQVALGTARDAQHG
jgi:hypothetical protein